jgi:hypothetical protein
MDRELKPQWLQIFLRGAKGLLKAVLEGWNSAAPNGKRLEPRWPAFSLAVPGREPVRIECRERFSGVHLGQALLQLFDHECRQVDAASAGLLQLP